jgi:uncharacterized protein involved in outer membrane biogenesis
MELTVSLAVVLLAIAAVAVAAFYIVWSRRSKPTSTRPETEPPPDRKRDAEPWP